MTKAKFLQSFTGCDVGEVRAAVLPGTGHHRAAEALVSDGILRAHQLPGEQRIGYSLTVAGKVRADRRVGRIG